MKTILFTGARSGIATKVIERIKNDYIIYVTVHTLNELKYVEKKYKNNKNIKCMKLDITSKLDLKKIENIDIDILVANAAICYGGSICEIDINKLRDNFEVNVFANFNLVQLFLKKMIKKNDGKIIIMASLAGIVPFNFMDSYSATKASIISLTINMKNELKLIGSKIKICMIEPGFYMTGFNQFMFMNKYDDYITYFKDVIDIIRNREKFITNFIEKKNFNSIVDKIEKSIRDINPKFIYRAPFSQVVFAKMYQLLRE